MSDYTELKSAIECILNQGALEREFVEDADLLDAAWAVYDALGPTDILALIAENEQLTDSRNEARENRNKIGDRYDQLKADNEALRKALGSCAEELSAEVICKHGGQKLEDMHPVTRRLYERDMAPVIEARAAIGKGELS